MFPRTCILTLAIVSLTMSFSNRSTAQENGPLTHTMKSLAGEDINLSDYQGDVVLLVNVASRCGLTRQYEQLQALHDKYSEKGLRVLGFPCNQFGGQEPGSAEQIREFCSSKYGVEFPMFSKIEVNGDNACELYKFLTTQHLEPAGKGDISWNFEKFLVGRDGQLVARYSPRTAPDDPELLQAIEAELAKSTQ